MTDKENKAENFWANHRADARQAEAALDAAAQSPGEMAKVRGGVAKLKALYISRMGKLPNVKWNNKPGEDGAESTLLQAVRTAVTKHEESVVPPTPERPGSEEVETDEHEPEDEIVTCEDCGRELETEGAEPDCIESMEEDWRMDYFMDSNGRVWCRCGAHVPALED